MAAKTAKTRNGDRRSGKAWGKNHNAPVKVLSPEAQERKAHKDAERARRGPASHERGSNITMPRFTWEWAAESISAGTRLAHTRRFRMVEACMAQQRRGDTP